MRQNSQNSTIFTGPKACDQKRKMFCKQAKEHVKGILGIFASSPFNRCLLLAHFLSLSHFLFISTLFFFNNKIKPFSTTLLFIDFIEEERKESVHLWWWFFGGKEWMFCAVLEWLVWVFWWSSIKDFFWCTGWSKWTNKWFLNF